MDTTTDETIPQATEPMEIITPETPTTAPEINDIDSLNDYLGSLTEDGPDDAPPPAEVEPETVIEEDIPRDEPESDPKNYRLAAADDIDKQAFALHKAGRGKISMTKIMAMLQPDTATTPATKQQPDTSQPGTAEPKTLRSAELEAQKEELDARIADAADSLDFSLVSKLQNERTDISLEIRDAKQAEAQAQQREADAQMKRNEALFYDYLKRAASDYPDAVIQGSPLWNEMATIDQDLEERGNDLFYNPAKAYKIAQMAANNLGIAPRTRSAQAQGATRDAGVRPRPLAGGTSSQGRPAQTPKGWDGIKTVDQLEAFLALAQ